MSELILKEDALNCFHDWIDRYGYEHTADEDTVYQRIEALDTVRCCDEDCISRRVAIEAIDDIESEVADGFGFQYEKWREYFCELPAVQPDHNADVSKKVTDEDCISRRAAIELCDWYDNPSLHDDLEKLPSVQPERVCVATVTLTDEQVKEVAEKAKNAVISVIETEPHWIPCGERLPEEKQSVLVTDGSVVLVCDIISTDEGYKWEDSHGYWLDLNEWIAWMKLPELYKEGDTE